MVTPTVGRIVHFQTGGGGPAPRAALITQVAAGGFDPFRVGLAIFTPGGLVFNPDVPYSAPLIPGHWTWPPRAD